MRTFLLICLKLSLATACQPNTLFEDYKTTSSELIWKKDNKITFEVDYKKMETDAVVWIMARHTMHFAYTNLPIIVDITGPNQYQKRSICNIPIRDENGMVMGSALGDLVDIEYKSDIQLKDNGKYTFTYTVGTKEDILDVMEVGLSIRK